MGCGKGTTAGFPFPHRRPLSTEDGGHLSGRGRPASLSLTEIGEQSEGEIAFPPLMELRTGGSSYSVRHDDPPIILETNLVRTNDGAERRGSSSMVERSPSSTTCLRTGE